MFVIAVSIKVKPDCIDEFIAETRLNHLGTVQESGAVRFDVLQSESDPTHFCLYEVYHSAAGLDAHRETEHFKRWRAAAEPMMSEPRTRVVYRSLFPDPWT